MYPAPISNKLFEESSLNRSTESIEIENVWSKILLLVKFEIELEYAKCIEPP